MTIKDYSLKDNAGGQGGGKPLGNRTEQVIKLLADLDDSELAEIRYAIDELQPLDLEKLDLNAELALQYRMAKVLLVEVQKDSATPANQKAQIFNAVRAQLSDIVKQQESVWSMERLKTFEVAFLKAANALTPEARDVFFELYVQYLTNKTMAGVPIDQVGTAAPAPAQESPRPPRSAHVEPVPEPGAANRHQQG